MNDSSMHADTCKMLSRRYVMEMDNSRAFLYSKDGQILVKRINDRYSKVFTR